ncbi:MAG: LacI family DNA-binding transcriptional regulator [Burkholderiales bacterium]|nr:LacI family DNA-binding transcriptional regulator [Burkholderiales bacterium]
MTTNHGDEPGAPASGVKGNRFGASAVNLKDIARRAGVSPITVSRVINKPEMVSDATRSRVMSVMNNMGFVLNRLASSFSHAGSRIVGTVAPPIINSGIAEQVQGMSDVFANSGYQLLVSPGDLSADNEKQQIISILGWQPVGLILQAFTESDDIRESLRLRRLPVVEISEIAGKEPIDCLVGISNHEAARRMTLFLAELGYERISFMGALSHGNDRAMRRTLGYRAAMAELGRPPAVVVGPLHPTYAADGLSNLMRIAPRTQVVFCASDTFAIATIQECWRRGLRVPEDIAIAGFGDLDLAPLIVPAITTVRVNRYHMGQIAAKTLLRRIAGEKGIQRVQDVGFSIVRRESA